jgi:hypothetical protein
MKILKTLALAAALAIGCSSGSKSTRTTTAGNETGVTQSGSISGTQGTAAGANGAQGTATASAGTTNTPNSGTVSGQAQVDTNTQGAMSPQQPQSGSTIGGVSGQANTGTSAGSVSGSNPPSGSSGTYTQSDRSQSDRSSGSMGGSATGTVAGSTDLSNLKTVTGSVAKVDENSITLDQAAGGVTLTVDSQTQVIRKGKPSAGISSIREGEQVRASFDPASNRAEKIEVMGKAKLNKQHKTMGDNTSGMNDNSGTSGSVSGSTGKTKSSTETDSIKTPKTPDSQQNPGQAPAANPDRR